MLSSAAINSRRPNRMRYHGAGGGAGAGAGLDKGKNVNRAMINVKANDINNRIERSNAVDYESDGRAAEEDEQGYPGMAIIIVVIIIIIVGRLDRARTSP